MDDTDWATLVTTPTGGCLREWSGAVLKKIYLTPSYRMLNLFVCFNVEPKGRTSEVITETGYLLYVIGTGQPIDIPLTIYRHMLDALRRASTTSLSSGDHISRILISQGVAISPQDSIVKGRGKITYRSMGLFASHVDDSGEDDPVQGEAATKTRPQFDPHYDSQMPAYFQDFENHLFDQSTQIELIENCMDSQFQEVFA